MLQGALWWARSSKGPVDESADESKDDKSTYDESAGDETRPFIQVKGDASGAPTKAALAFKSLIPIRTMSSRHWRATEELKSVPTATYLVLLRLRLPARGVAPAWSKALVQAAQGGGR